MAGTNTYSASLLTDILEQEAITILSDVLAPLSAFARQFSTDTYKPKSTAQAKFVTSGATTQKNASDFEQGDSTVANVAIAPDQYSQSFQVSNADLNSGLRLADLAEKNCRVFGETLMDAILVPLTIVNFPTPIVRAAAAFGPADMAECWGRVKKSPIKSAILDGEWMARILNSPVFLQEVKPGSAGWRIFGWDGVYTNTRWTGAGANVHGFFCGASALGVLAGLPIQGENRTLQSKVVTLEGLDLSVMLNSWFSLKTRSMWCSYDLVMGSALLDATCGVLLTSE